MRATEEIGNKKALKFVIYSLIEVIYHNLIDHLLNFPQFRKLFLQILGSQIGSDSFIMKIKFFNLHHYGPKGLKIGDKCFIGDEVLIDLYDKVILLVWFPSLHRLKQQYQNFP